MGKPQGMPPESVKEENVRCTSSPQVRTTCVNRNTPDFESEFSDSDIQCTPPCPGKASIGNQNVTWDIFDKILLKKKVDQDTIPQAKSCDDYVTCKSQMDRPFGVIPLSPSEKLY